VYRFVASLVAPLSLGFLCALVATALLWRKRRGRRRRLAWLTAILLLLALSSTRLIGHPAIGTLEWMYPPESSLPDHAGVIVVLGSGTRVIEGPQEHVELDPSGAFRCIHAAKVYRRAGPCPVIVSGGKASAGDPGPAPSGAMRVLLIDLGVAASDIIVEDASRTTYENAVNSCELLEERNLADVVLVTDAAHMFRSAGCFRELGVDVVPAACNYRATSRRWSAETFLPMSCEARKTEAAAHEWLGIAWYWLRGRI
jgi:uncharacterized SAM-binding protein YcdF (DUF218 family)